LVNNTLKELRYAFKIFSPYRFIKKVIIFGSARSKKASAEYLMAEEFARKLTAKGYMIVTGGGSGIMEAGNKGSEAGKEFALNIRLPFEQKPNPYIYEKDKIINFKYFFTRKLIFIKETDATALFPGGFGTHDEGFEMLTLIQTGKSKPRPIVLIESKGSRYWEAWKRYVVDHLLKNGFIEKDDLKLFRIAKSVDEAIKYIEYKEKLKTLSNITFLPETQNKFELINNLNMFKFYFTLSTGEAFNVALQEAIACGTIPLVRKNSAYWWAERLRVDFTKVSELIEVFEKYKNSDNHYIKNLFSES
jgi:uncharacterized protein (TIGR00730 family)